MLVCHFKFSFKKDKLNFRFIGTLNKLKSMEVSTFSFRINKKVIFNQRNKAYFSLFCVLRLLKKWLMAWLACDAARIRAASQARSGVLHQVMDAFGNTFSTGDEGGLIPILTLYILTLSLSP